MTHDLVTPYPSTPFSGLDLAASSSSFTLPAPLPAESQMMGEPSIALPPVLDSELSRVGQGIDILWRHSGVGQVAGWFLDQQSIGRSRLIGDVVSDSSWILEGTGDFNNDAEEDLLWRHAITGQVVVWYMNNGELQRSGGVGDVVPDTRWEIEGVGDFNRDGHDDILWRHYGSGEVLAWQMDGTGNIQGRQVIGQEVSDLNWRIEGVGDFNGDSVEDLLWRNYASGQNRVFHLDSEGQVISSALIGPVMSDLNWSIAGVGDFNKDGETDILLHHAVSGENLSWLMNDHNLIGTRTVGPNISDNQWTPIVSRRSLDDIPAASSEPSPSPPESTSSFAIEFDYRFDTNGWFTAERRAALESAAEVWERIILDDFETTPAGTATPFVTNPQTDDYAGNNGIFITDTEIDDLVIFVGARAMNSGTLGQGGASGYYLNEDRYVGSDFEPWLGSIAFNSNSNWFFDATPDTSNDIPSNQNDFISTAVHEIGHVLGFSSSIEAFKAHLNGAGDFAGPNAMARNGGSAIPLQGSHIQDGYEFGDSGEAVLDPISFTGARQLPTVLDIAIFDDIGYEVNYSQARSNSSENRSSGVTGDTGLNRRVAIAETSTQELNLEDTDGALAIGQHDRLVPACCSCASCETTPLGLAWVGDTDLAQMIGV